jgi:eukaryotic-like serine/threonine-protein kinase
MKSNQTKGGRRGTIPFDVFTPVQPVPQIPRELPPLVDDSPSSPSHIGPRGSTASLSSLSKQGIQLPFELGEIIADKYSIERVLGVGGMGIIVAARHLQLDRPVAIKFLRPDVAALPEAEPRFAREAKAAARMQSEHVVGILDVGALPSGLPYMVMEFLEGKDLSALVKKQGRVPIPQAVEYILQACEALAEAHSLGIVHRDLKPSNICVTRRPDGTEFIKLLDFGIAKVAPPPEALEQEHSLTTGNGLMGSPLYMSPDQLQNSRDIDGRTDIWSLGAILYKLVTGTPPFLADTVPQLCTMILTAPPQSIRAYVPDAPPEFEAVILKCLEKRPEERFQNVAQLALSLASFAPQRAQVSVERAVRVVGAAGGDVGRPLVAVTGGASPPPAVSSGGTLALDSPTRLRPDASGSMNALKSGQMNALKSGQVSALQSGQVSALQSGSMSALRLPEEPPIVPLGVPTRSGKLVAVSAFLATMALASLVFVTLHRAHLIPGGARTPLQGAAGAPTTAATVPPPAIDLAPTIDTTPVAAPPPPAASTSAANAAAGRAATAPTPPPAASSTPAAASGRARSRAPGKRIPAGDDEFGGRK